MDPNAAFNLFLGQLIYGVPTDDANPGGADSALRGHSLAETMYGSYDSLGNVPSDVPYNGTGRLHFAQPAPAVVGSGRVQHGQLHYFPADGFVRDPGRGSGTRGQRRRASRTPLHRRPERRPTPIPM